MPAKDPPDWRGSAQRFSPPRQHIRLARRDRLIGMLEATPAPPLVVVAAPAGFGKSTLLAQWWEQLAGRRNLVRAWLSARAGHEDPAELLADILRSLRAAAGGAPFQPLPQPATARWLHDELGRQLQAIGRRGERLVLMLDDCHLVSAAGLTVLADEFLHAPTGDHRLVLAGREPLPLGFSHEEARGLVRRIGAPELRLAHDQVATLFDGLDDVALALLHARTEGWPVAVQLAAIWLRRQGSAGAAAVARLSGRSEQMARYLMEHVVGELDPALRAFAIDIAILDSFDARLADAVRDRADSRAFIEQLSHLDALLVPMDDRRQRFRYHPMLADYLAQCLEALPDRHATALHRRAATELAAAGDLLAAVGHAVAARDVVLATRLVEAAGGWEVLIRAGPGFSDRLLGQFDEAALRSSPTLQIVKAYRLINQGLFTEARVRLDAIACRIPPDGRLARDHMLVDTLLRGYADNVHDPGFRPLLEARLAAADPSDHLAHGCLHGVLVTGDIAAAAFDQADREIAAALPHWRAAAIRVGEAHGLIHGAQCLFHRGRLNAALAAYDKAIETGRDWEAPDELLDAILGCLRGNLLYWRDEQADARALLGRWLDVLDRHDAWLDIYACAYRAAVALDYVHGGIDAACSTTDRAQTLARRRGFGVLETLSQAWRLEVLVVGGRTEAAAALVTAEHLVERQRQTGQSWRCTQALGIALAQWQLKAGRAAAALPILRSLKPAIEAQGRLLDDARVQALTAAALWQRGDKDAAVAALVPALQYVGAEAAFRAIMDTAVPMEPLLQAASEAGGAPASTAREVLAALGRAQRDARDGLSSRELAVLRQLALGRSNKQVAWHLGCSDNTVKFHLKNIYARLQVTNRNGAVAAAMARGLVQLD